MSDPTPRVPPFFCPYCGEQDLRPAVGTGWHCRTCDRRFEVGFLGLGVWGDQEASRQASDRPPRQLGSEEVTS